ncbi:RecBCD enzyme subunit RecC [Burkholderiales bacterium 8X]|nr:RecBCD enzyme subunit RecC [Burkholderiales bacterium 8X]
MTETSLFPGFMVVHGNHPEALRDLMLAWMIRHPLAPLEDECVLVQSNGVAQWLKLSLARDAEQGGAGISAAIRTELPATFLWQAFRAVLGADAVPQVSPFDKNLLVWRLMRLLPGLLREEVFAPLRRFLADDDDLRKRHQLAERLADLFDQYQVYRSDWLQAWEQAGGEGGDLIVTSRQGSQAVADDLRWQPRLWRALLEDVGPAGAASSRSAVHRRFLARAAAWEGERPAGLPRRLVVFGISSLPQQSLDVLAALARWVQVLMCVHNPSEHDWSHIVADKDLLRAERRRQRQRPAKAGAIPDDAALHVQGQPLLAAWGKQGRDFIRLIDAHDDQEAYANRFAAIGQRIDCFETNARDTMLRQLQDDIRDLRPIVETRATWPAVDARLDRSIVFHVAHGPQREVEVLHDQLLAAFAADSSLRPRDVIVMVPDVAVYAPHIQAVFGLMAPGDERYVPYTVSDQGQRHHDPLLAALERLLALPQSRLTSSDVLDWLEVPALRARFGIEQDQLPMLHRWIAAANIRWGLHAEHRQALELPAGSAQNSWDFGLQRMLLGYAVGAGEAWHGIEPLDEVGGLEAAMLGSLAGLLSRLEGHWRALNEACAPAEWGVRLGRLLADFFEPQEEADGFTLQRLEGALQDWLEACAEAGLEEPLPLSVVREHWLAQIDQPALNRPFFAGTVTFATLLPMRAIPFRFVALLGMNDGDYPRHRVAADFDLMTQDWRPGDRSRREDDRYLFLEALLSARDRLHLSWVGRSIHDQTERPPSVLVAQLRDHLAAGWRLANDESASQAEAGRRLLRAITVEHRLQPFDSDYFARGRPEGLFSYAREWRASWVAPAAAMPGDDDALPPWTPSVPLDLRQLTDFLKEPARSFFRVRLSIRLKMDEATDEDQEPFEVDALHNWKLQDELIEAQRLAVEEGAPRELAMKQRLERIAGRGELPAGPFAELVQEELGKPMTSMFEAYRQALAEWPHALPDAEIDFLPEGATEGLRFQDWLVGLRSNDAGERCRLVLESRSLIKNNRYRRDKLVAGWIAHLAGHLGGKPLTTLMIGKNGNVRLRPLDPSQAHDSWRRLIEAWQLGLSRPLPLALQSGLAWLERAGFGTGSNGAEAYEAARATFEDHEPTFNRVAERERSPYLARAFADFEALWSDGEFARWSRALLEPMCQAVDGASAR